MALAQQPLRQTKIFAVASQKRFSVFKRSQDTVGTADKSALFTVKFNPDWSEGLSAGIPADAATVSVDPTNIILDVDGVLDRNVAHAGLTVQEMIDAINATQSDQTNRWRAGLADAAPNLVATPSTQSDLNAMVGYLGGVRVSHEVNETVFLAVGTDESDRGAGNFLPDGFNWLYDYPLTRFVGGFADPLPSQIGRSGGIDAAQGEDVLPQRRSAFRKSPAALGREESSAALRFETVVDAIWTDVIVPDGGPGVPIIARIFDGEGNLVWSQLGGAVPPIHFVPANIAVRGPAYITVGSDGSGGDNTITAGTVTVTGFTRRA